MLEEANARVNSGRLTAEQAIEQQRGRFIRSTSGLRDILSQPTEDGVRLSDAMHAASQQAEELMQTVAALEESIQTIDDRLQAFVGRVGEFADAQDTVNAKGYVSAGWRAAYKELKSVALEAQKQRERGAVLSVQDLIEGQESRLAELMEKVVSVPEWHEQVVARYEQTLRQQNTAISQIELAKNAAAEVRATYDVSCFGDIDTHLDEAETHLKAATSFAQKTSLEDVRKKDVDTIAANEAAISEVQIVISEAVSHSNAVIDHRVTLERIAESAPSRVRTISEDITSALELADGYGSDVEPSTVAKIRELLASNARLSLLLQEQKPQYLTIDATADMLDENVRTVAAKVQSEYAEMVRMRADVASSTASLEAAVSALRMKAQSNQRDIDANTQQLLQTLETYQGAPQTREELRIALSLISSLADRYNSADSAVSNDIRQAKARRTQSTTDGYSSSSRSSGSVRRGSSSSSSSSRRASGSSRSSSSRSSGSTKRR